MSLPVSLDTHINYALKDRPKEAMWLKAFGQKLTLDERYELAKTMYPCAFFDEDTESNWSLERALDLGVLPAHADDLILVERLPDRAFYYWKYARNLHTGEFWPARFI